jgi:hypothetical protein
VHVLRLGEAQRAADEALDPGPAIDVFALHVLGILLAYLMLRGISMPLVAPQPSVENFVMPDGANSCWSFRKTSSCRRPNTYANTFPVW